jgi:addiction module HigA family antidote
MQYFFCEAVGQNGRAQCPRSQITPEGPVLWRLPFGLKVPKKQKPRGRLWLNDGSCVRLRSERRNHVWSYDFGEAQTHDGRELRLLTLIDEFTRECLAMGVQRKHVNELCNGRRNVTAATALILACVFGNSPDFWLNVQRRTDLWEAIHSPKDRVRIERARPLRAA